MDNSSEDLWENYGFKDNPFDTTPLSLQSGTALPIQQAFVSRGTDCQATGLVTNLLRSSGGGRFVLEGDLGVGKTTFVNYHKYRWEKDVKNKLFVPLRELSFSPDWHLRDFLLNVLSLLITKILLLKGEKYVAKHPLLQELMLLNKVHNAQSLGIKATIWGWGGGISKKQEVSLPPLPEAQLFHYFVEVVSSIREMGYRGVLLHFDNLELVSKESIEKAKKVFEEIRDSLQVRHVYYVFVSQPGFFGSVIASLPRVRSIFFGWPINLRPLSKKETLKAIYLRYKLLTIPGMKFIQPVEDSFIEYLYEVYDGQIRFVMDSIYAILMHNPFLLPRTLKTEEAKPLLQSIATQKIQQVVSPKEWEILILASRFDRITNGEISKHLGIIPQNVNKYLKSLVEKGYMKFLEKDGRRAFYGVSEDAKILKIFSDKKGIFGIQENPLSETPLKKRQKDLLSSLKDKISVKEYSERMEISFPTASRDLKELQHLGLIKSHRSGRQVFYEKGS